MLIHLAECFYGLVSLVTRVPFCVMLIGISSSFWSTSKIYPRILWFLLATFCLSGLADMSTQFWYSFVDRFEIGSPGGLIGDSVSQ